MKVAIYVRVSTEEQAKEGYSIDAQIRALTNHFEAKGDTIVKIYKDDGYSGKNIKDRPQLNQLILDSKKSLFNVVAVWRINRLSRKQLDFLTLIDNFEKLSITFFSLNDQIDSSTSIGKAMLQIMGTFAELERNQIIENVKSGMNEKANKGEWNGGQVLGYKSINKQLVIDENEAILVRYIYEQYNTGKGLLPIANQLNIEGYKTKRGGSFSINTVKTILKNPLYAGFIRFNHYENYSEQGRKNQGKNEILTEGIHEAIISRELWDKTQSIMQSKSSKPAKVFYGHYPLTSILRCPMCNGAMIGHRVRGKRYYQCSVHRNKGTAICKTNLVYADVAEEFVFKKLQHIANTPTLLKELVNNANSKIAKLKQPIEEELKYVSDMLIRTNKAIKNLVFSLESSPEQSVSVMKRINKLENEESALLVQKQNLEYELLSETKTEITYEEVYQILNMFSVYIKQISPEQVKDLLHSIISKITVHPSDKIEKRSVKDIELFFDASKSPSDVLTYDTVHPD